MNTYEIVRLYDYDNKSDRYMSSTNGGSFTAEDDIVAAFSFGMAFGKRYPKMKLMRAFLSPNEVIGMEVVNHGKIEYVCVRRKVDVH